MFIYKESSTNLQRNIKYKLISKVTTIRQYHLPKTPHKTGSGKALTQEPTPQRLLPGQQTGSCSAGVWSGC